MDVVLIGGGAALVLGLLYWFSAWWDRREWRKRNERAGITEAPLVHGPVQQSEASSAPLLRRLQPTWPLVAIVAVIAGVASSIATRAVSSRPTKQDDTASRALNRAGDAVYEIEDLKSRVSSLRSRVDDLESKLRSHDHD